MSQSDSDNKPKEPKRLSSAPPPIRPIRGSGRTTVSPPKCETKTPDWREWGHTPNVKPWQACALSLNIDPHSLQFISHEWMIGESHERFFKDSSFPNLIIKNEFELRQRVLLANFSNADASGNQEVRLGEFAFWASTVVKWENLPNQLLNLATSRNNPDVTAKVSSAEQIDELEIGAAYTETVYNGKSISWRYWVEQMPSLTAGQAARLMSALDPDVFESLDARPNKNDPTKSAKKAKMIQRLAETQGMSAASPREWLDWAQSHRFKVHIGFLLAIERLTEKTEILTNQVSDIAKDTHSPSVANWKMQIQTEAARRWKSLLKSGASPTKNNMKGDLAKWCREKNVKTDNGVFPSGDYIQRHVLRSWTPPSN